MSTSKIAIRRSPDNVTTAADLRSLVILSLRDANWSTERIAGFVQCLDLFGAARSSAPIWLRQQAASLVVNRHGLDGATTMATTAAVLRVLRVAGRYERGVGEGDLPDDDLE